MASKKDNLPQAVENDMEQGNTITYANEVVAIIAGVAAGEVEGIAERLAFIRRGELLPCGGGTKGDFKIEL